jgi:thiol-disulfide isomerase/thioredoxin
MVCVYTSITIQGHCMKSILLLLLVPFFMTQTATVEVLKWPALEKHMTEKNGKIKIINFWATNCKPCVEELPHFEQLHRSFGNQVEVILVSVDEASTAETKVNPVLERSRITAKVLLLDEVDANSWINKVDPTWSGAIPATVVIDQNNNRQLFEKPLSYQELVKIIHDIHKP